MVVRVNELWLSSALSLSQPNLTLFNVVIIFLVYPSMNECLHVCCGHSRKMLFSIFFCILGTLISPWLMIITCVIMAATIIVREFQG